MSKYWYYGGFQQNKQSVTISVTDNKDPGSCISQCQEDKYQVAQIIAPNSCACSNALSMEHLLFKDQYTSTSDTSSQVISYSAFGTGKGRKKRSKSCVTIA